MEGSLVAYKVFTNGSVLNASEINDNLMNQSVAVFSNAAARSAAITSPVEGQVTYLEDSNSYQYWNGSWFSLVQNSNNIILNGAFEINQRRYSSGSNLSSGSYGFDRWKSNFTNTTLTFTATSGGQEIQINSGGGLQQIIERSNVLAGTYTLSWSGTSTGRVYNFGATPPSYSSSPITVNLDGSANVVVEFTASGSAKTLSKVQFEPGSAPTAFRTNSNTFEGELAACQRYYVFLGRDQAFQNLGLSGFIESSTVAKVFHNFPTTLRVAPTSLDFGGALQIADANGGAIATLTGVLVNGGLSSNIGFTQWTILGGTAGRFAYLRSNNDTTAFVGFSAEL
jgi:hypothetical protein